MTGPLAWEPPYAKGAAPEMAKRQNKQTNKKQVGGSNCWSWKLQLDVVISRCPDKEELANSGAKGDGSRSWRQRMGPWASGGAQQTSAGRRE